MALDPFFQQGMNAWTAQNQVQSGRASKLNALVQSGQMKDALQQLGHKQKMTEGKQTGRYALANTALGKGISSILGAEEMGGLPTSATDDIGNVLRADRSATNISRMGGPQMAAQQGKFNINPTQVLAGTQLPQYREGTPTSETVAKLGSKVEQSDEEQIDDIIIGEGPSAQTGLVKKRKRKKGRSASVKGNNARKLLRQLEQLTQGGQAKVLIDSASHGGFTGRVYEAKGRVYFAVGPPNEQVIDVTDQVKK